MAIVWLLLVALVSLVLPYLLLQRGRRERAGSNKHLKLPPGPKQLPLIGNLHQLGELPHQALWQLSKIHGPVIFLKLGTIPTVFVSSVAAARDVLKARDLDFCSRPSLVATDRIFYNRMDIGFAPYGDYWRQMRKLCMVELLSTRRVQSFQDVRREEVALMIKAIASKSSSSSPIDVRSFAQNLANNIVCQVAFSARLRHRGPDWSGIHCFQDCYLAHQRLAIVDPASGDQPLYNEDKSIVVTVNGEIYNHEELKENLPSHTFRTGSDCEVIAHLYEEHGEDFVDMLDGMFSFVLLDTRDKSFIAARDAIGITPLYMGWGLDGSIWFSSEMKALSDDCERFVSFLPGHIYSSKRGALRRWYNPPWFKELTPSTPYDPLVLREAFEKAVIKRLMTDVPFGVLLSGGLDSSLFAAVASWHLAKTKAAKQWGSQLHTFCIGLKGSTDLKAAREVADYLGTLHHEFHFTVQEGVDALEEVIYHTETYDVTTIRASTPMFLMSRKIKSLGVKMVLSGEGSDEIFGGYLYFHKAPNKDEFHLETCRKIKSLHLYDCLRANKSTSAWGVEARVPFLDKNFLNIAMDIDPEWKMIRPDLCRIEKWILRNAFDDDKNPFLPKVSDAMLMNASFVYPENNPTTKEGYYYRTIFERFFPKNAARSTVPGGPSVACSTAKAVEWDAAWSKNPDPSGRAALGIHVASYESIPENISATENMKSLNVLPKKLEEGIAEPTAAAT